MIPSRSPAHFRLHFAAAVGSLFAAALLSGACTTSVEDARDSRGDGSDTDGGQATTADAALGDTALPSVAPSDLCADYIACVSKTNPAGLGVVLGVYGEGGTCWQSQSVSFCGDACLSGLRQNHTAFPHEAACPQCLLDEHCNEAGKPGCDRATSECVSCTKDEHCPGGACNVGTHSCVACTSDAQCGGKTPACDVTRHTCVACNADAQCPSSAPACDARSHTCTGCRTNAHCPATAPICNAGSSTCCATRSCGSLRAQRGTARWICGTTNDSCAPVDCGICPSGQCLDGECSKAGVACTPPGTSTCAQGEICAYDSSKKNYFCSYDFNGTSCTYPDFNGNQCANVVAGTTLPVRIGFSCALGGTCEQTCKASTECIGGRTCRLFQGETWGVCR